MICPWLETDIEQCVKPLRIWENKKWVPWPPFSAIEIISDQRCKKWGAWGARSCYFYTSCANFWTAYAKNMLKYAVLILWKKMPLLLNLTLFVSLSFARWNIDHTEKKLKIAIPNEAVFMVKLRFEKCKYCFANICAQLACFKY